MNIQHHSKNPNSSEDLTVVLLRGNSSPRSFRVPLPRLYRSLTFVGFTFFTSLLLSGIFVLYLSYQTWNQEEPGQASVPSVVAPPPVATPTPVPNETAGTGSTSTMTITVTATATETATAVATEDKTTSLWDKLAGSKSNSPEPAPAAANSSETEKELAGLREDLAKLNNKNDGREEVKPGDGPVSLLSQRAALIPKPENIVDVKNIKVLEDAGKAKVKFELHNTDTNNKQVRGYILVMAKSSDALFIYPSGAFAPRENILVNYTRGETFAVSRFREAIATFPAPVNAKDFQFQILLFRSDGKMISHQHVEKK